MDWPFLGLIACAIPTIVRSDPNALDRCEAMTKQPEEIQDWSELALALSQNGETEPPTDASYEPEISV